MFDASACFIASRGRSLVPRAGGRRPAGRRSDGAPRRGRPGGALGYSSLWPRWCMPLSATSCSSGMNQQMMAISTYVAINIAPSSQFEEPSCRTLDAKKTDNNMTVASKALKSRDIGTSQIQPTITENGTTKRAICVEEPMATPSARSIFPLAATVTAVACSAALPTMGSRMTPMKALGKPYSSLTPSMESTRYSEHTATQQVAARSSPMAVPADIMGVSSSSSSAENMSACVTSWNHKNSR
mmetsp:Transcript_141956/g.353790  ORF Transcript_141956/g.353790 Transcript_141956/m.353790 type:complete len:242 (-) Transcript_141956:914-1639(-)